MPILVMKDSMSGSIDTNVAPHKGECGFATNCGVSFLEYIGNKRIHATTDQDEAILQIKGSINREWG